MTQYGASQPVRRVEDARFVTGHGRYMDDINLPGQAYGYMLRSTVAHATIRGIDTAAAEAAPGVIAVITGAELDAAEVNHLPCLLPLENQDGSPMAQPPRPVICADKVRHVGDNVAFVVAETLVQAKDAAELIDVDYDMLGAVVDTAGAADAGQAQIHGEAANNTCFDWAYGDADTVAAAFAKAAKTVELEIVNNRLIVNTMEPRGVIAAPATDNERMTVHAGTQGSWLVRDVLAGAVLKAEPSELRLITPDVGGGFGMKAFIYPEYAAAMWAAKQLDRPVKWIGERSDAFISDAAGRDNVTRAELAFDAEHRIIGMRVDTFANLGAYLSSFAPFIPTMANLKVVPGIYDVKCLHTRVRGVFTNTVAVDAYRGAGRPEAIYLIERMIDKAADDLGVDRIELRRRNLIPSSAVPFQTAAGETYDSGDFETVMNMALEGADWSGIEARKAEAAKRGRARGIGLCYYIESTMGPEQEMAAIKFEDDGTVIVAVGTQSTGQGHETAYAQVLHERLGVPFESIRVVQGDTDMLRNGGGTGGSRSLTAEGWAINETADEVIDKGKHYAAQLLEAAVTDIEFGEGTFRIAGTDRAIGVIDLAREAKAMPTPPEGVDGGLDSEKEITVGAWTFPNGCHVAEVEIDPETGVTNVVRYSIVDDFGRVLNPLLVEGQVHGGVAQGIGQALYEHTVHDSDGQLLTGSFMDYAMPRADDMPSFEFATHEVPCANNEMGVKGCGEAGSLASPPAVINAMVDALSDRDVKHIDMPATPQKVWQLLHKQ